MENINIKSDKGNDFIQKIITIQSEIYAPKNRKNTFGKFSYRSVEDIYDALKKKTLQHQLFFIVSDEIVEINSKFFVKSTATITNGFDYVSAYGLAELLANPSKNRMDESQATGSASSYARKYALNGLLGLGEEDPDFFDNSEPPVNNSQRKTVVNSSRVLTQQKTPGQQPTTAQPAQPINKQLISEKQKGLYFAKLKEWNITKEEADGVLRMHKIDSTNNIPISTFKDILNDLENLTISKEQTDEILKLAQKLHFEKIHLLDFKMSLGGYYEGQILRKKDYKRYLELMKNKKAIMDTKVEF